MNKKYIVRLNDQERQELVAVITKLKGTSQKVKRAQILLKADVDGPNWPHYQIAEAFLCRTRTVSNVCKSLVERGFDIALNGMKRDTPPFTSVCRTSHFLQVGFTGGNGPGFARSPASPI